jgi:hypothetical protein
MLPSRDALSIAQDPECSQSGAQSRHEKAAGALGAGGFS